MIFFSLALLVGFFNGSGRVKGWFVLILAFASFSFLWTSCYLLNDLCDKASDVYNKLDRPLPKKRATEGHYLWAFGLLSSAGLLLSITLPLMPAFYLIVCWLLGVGYSIPSIRLKRIPVLSLFPSAASFSLLVICGSSLRGGMTLTTIVVSLMMFFLVFLAGNAKDMGDIRGDSMTKSTTLPMLIGTKATAWLVLIASIVIGCVAILFLLFLPSGPSISGLCLIGVTVLVSGGILLVKREEPNAIQVRRTNVLQSVGAILILIAYIVASSG